MPMTTARVEWPDLVSTAWRAANSATRHPQDREDLQQELLLIFLSMKKRGLEPFHPTAWLYAVARRLSTRLVHDHGLLTSESDQRGVPLGKLARERAERSGTYRRLLDAHHASWPLWLTQRQRLLLQQVLAGATTGFSDTRGRDLHRLAKKRRTLTTTRQVACT